MADPGPIFQAAKLFEYTYNRYNYVSSFQTLQIIFSLFKLASIRSFSSAVLRPPLRPYRLPEASGKPKDRACALLPPPMPLVCAGLAELAPPGKTWHLSPGHHVITLIVSLQVFQVQGFLNPTCPCPSLQTLSVSFTG